MVVRVALGPPAAVSYSLPLWGRAGGGARPRRPHSPDTITPATRVPPGTDTRSLRAR